MMEQHRLWEHYQTKGSDSFRHSIGRLQALAKRFRPGLRVLNIGVGDGAFERLALARGLVVYSLDPSPSAIEGLRQTLGLGDRARVGMAESIPWENGSFDGVVMSEVMEHLEEKSLEATLASVKNSLAPQGEFWGTVPDRENLSLNEVFCPGCSLRFHRWGHVQRFDVNRLSTLLQKSGFSPEYLQVRVFPICSGFRGWVRRVARETLSSVGLAEPAARNLMFGATVSESKKIDL